MRTLVPILKAIKKHFACNTCADAVIWTITTSFHNHPILHVSRLLRMKLNQKSNGFTESVKPDCWLACSSCFWRGILALERNPVIGNSREFKHRSFITYWYWEKHQILTASNKCAAKNNNELVSTWLRSKVAVDSVTLWLMGQVGHGLKSWSTYRESKFKNFQWAADLWVETVGAGERHLKRTAWLVWADRKSTVTHITTLQPCWAEERIRTYNSKRSHQASLTSA